MDSGLFFVLSTAPPRRYICTARMTALRTIFWTLVALVFSLFGLLIIGGITALGLLLILKDLITRSHAPTDDT